MRWRRLMWMAALPWAVGGCLVPSLYPCYEEDQAVQAPELAGPWREADDPDGVKPPWVFQPDGTVVTNQDGITSALEAVYFRVEDTLFVDWTAGDPSDQAGINVYWALHVMPTHSVLKVVQDGDRLALVPLSLNWLTQALAKDPALLPHRPGPDPERPLILAEPREWRAFLTRHAHDDEAFDPNAAFRFVRAPGPAPAR